MSLWVLSTKDDRKRRLFWGKIKPEPTVVWKILSSGVLGHSGAEMFRHELSELPKTHKQVGRWVSMFSICHMDPQSFISLHDKQQTYLFGNCKHTNLDVTVYILKKQQLESVVDNAHRMDKSCTHIVLIWNISRQCSSGFSCVMRGLIQLLIWLLLKPINYERWLLSSFFAFLFMSQYFPTKILHSEELGEDVAA